MREDIIAGIKARVQQLRKVISLAHDQRMIDALQQVVDSGEADIKKLEEEARRQA